MATRKLPVFRTNLDHQYNVVLDNETFTIEWHYNRRADRWTTHWLDATATPIRHGVRLVTYTDLLRRVALATKPAGSVDVVDTTGADTEPDGETLGVETQVRYVDA